MSEKPTPETDSKAFDWNDNGYPKRNSDGLYVYSDFARRLERERDEARMAILANMARETLTCGWCGDMMHAPPGFTPPMTLEKLQLTVKIHMLDCPKHPIRETERECEEYKAARDTLLEAVTRGDSLGNDLVFLLRYSADLLSKIVPIHEMPTVTELKAAADRILQAIQKTKP
jgi:hypothetical protein